MRDKIKINMPKETAKKNLVHFLNFNTEKAINSLYENNIIDLISENDFFDNYKICISIDTNFFLDFFFKRNKQTYLLFKELLKISKKDVILGLSVINLLEILEKIYTLSISKALINNNFSPDIIIRFYKNPKSNLKLNNLDKRVRKEINKILKENYKRLSFLLSRFKILYLSKPYPEDVILFRDLIEERNLDIQDILTISILSAFNYEENIIYFLTGDKHLSQSKILNSLIYVFYVKDKKNVDTFRNNVLKELLYKENGK